ncbi:MAG: GAF domain-containing sensor histidine kinase [Gracilimonas sp.]
MLTLVDHKTEIKYQVPENEAERQSKLEEYDILDTLPEEEFDSLVELAGIITNSPVSLMNILDQDRQWTKAAVGATSGKSIQRSETICQYTILEDQNFEVEDLTKDERFKSKPYVEGDPMYRSYSGYTLKSPDGYNLGTLCVLDTKPRKLDETQNKALKTIASEIMARLELRKKQHELEQLNKEKDLFLRAVNHDIKSPINGIISSAHYLQNQWDGDRDELNEFLSMIELSGRKLINYTSELMTNILLKEDSKLHIDEVKINELIEDLIHIYTPLAKAKHIDIKLDCDTPGSFKLDNEKFKLILSNLISNALKFCNKEDTIQVKATILTNSNSKSKTLHTSVTDTGIGIPEDFVPELFTKNKKHQRQGTQGEISSGMGLPIVKQFVELHGGGIKINTEDGKGTTFHIVIPEQE